VSFRRDKALQAAQQHAARGDLDQAIGEYQSVVEHDPNDVQSWLLLADILHRAGNLDAAIDRYAHAANILLEQGEIPNALQIFRQVLNLAPERYDIHLRTGQAFEQLRRYPEAVALYEKVAGVYLRSGNTREALMLYERVADLMPREVAKRLRLAELFSRERRVDEAIVQFQSGADFLRKAGRAQEYVRVAERLLYHRPIDDVSRELVRVYLEIGEPRRALMKLNELLQRRQSDPEGLELLAETFMRLDKVDKACSVVIELVRGQREEGPAGIARCLTALRKAVTWAPHNEQLTKLIQELGGALEPPASASDDSEAIDELELDEFEEFEELDELEEVDELAEPQPPAPRPAARPAVLEPVTHAQPVARPAARSGGQPQARDDDAPVGARRHSLTQDVISEGAQRSAEDTDIDLDKQLEEVRVLMKYHLFEHALGHAEQILATDPGHIPGLELLAEILASLGRNEPAADTRAALAQRLFDRDPAAAARHVELALALIPDHVLAVELGERLSEISGVSVGVADRRDALPHDEDPLAALELDDDLLGSIEASESLIGRVSDNFGDEYRGEGGGERRDDEFTDLDLDEPSAGGDIDIRTADPGLHNELNALGEDDDDFAISVDQDNPRDDDEDDGFDFEDRFGLGGDDDDDDEGEPAAEAGAPEASLDADTTSVFAQPTIGRVEPEPEPEPEDWIDLSAELEELEFYVAQDLEEDALAAFSDLVELFPGHPKLLELAHRFPSVVVAAPAKPAEAPLDAAAPLLDLEDEDEDEDDDFLAGIFDDEAPRERKKREVAIQTHEVEGADAGDRFDLGTAYREMGLLEKSFAEYEIASRDPRWQAKALVMMGSLRRESGDDVAATDLFTRAVKVARTKDERCEANYELAMAYLATARTEEAKQALALVEAGYRDRDEKLAEIA